MTLPADTPKLAKWPFLLVDGILLGTAAVTAYQSRDPFASGPLIAIVLCVIAGSIFAVIPFLSDYARKQDEALDNRQRELEALSRTVAASAEQVGIVANGLHELIELAQRNLKSAEQLPHKLQEKIAEFKAQLDNRREDEKEELEKEVAELRAAESERLASVADKIAKSATEWAKLEAATQKHLASATEAVGKLPVTASDRFEKLSATAEGVAKSVTAAEQSLLRLQENAQRGLDAVKQAATAAIDDKLAASFRSFEAKLRQASNEIAEQLSQTLRSRLETLPSSSRLAKPAETVQPAARDADLNDEPAAAASAREQPTVAIEPPGALTPSPANDSVTEPASARAEPVPSPSEPSSTPKPPEASAPIPDAFDVTAPPAPAVPDEAKPSRKRAPRKPREETPAEPAFNLQAEEPRTAESPTPDEFSQIAPDDAVVPPATSEPTESALSADGATRLLVTAYIGIGNRLFLRGDGPGLSWDKGVPLQFVSIGKWRWETSDASAPVTFKLYKNDSIECTGLGSQTLAPGHQQEVTASF